MDTGSFSETDGEESTKGGKVYGAGFYNANEIVLKTLIVSVEKDEHVEKFQSIATSNKIFVIDFKDIVTEE